MINIYNYILDIHLLLYININILIANLITFKFKINTKINKIIGSYRDFSFKLQYNRSTKVLKKKTPYFYISKYRKYNKIIDFNKYKLYKLLWHNSDFLKNTNLSLIKKNSSFKKKDKMLRSFLKKTIFLKKKKSKNLSLFSKNTYNAYNFYENKLNHTSTSKITKRKFKINNIKTLIKRQISISREKDFDRNKNRNKNPVFFKKTFLKTLITNRNIFKLIFKQKLKKKKKITKLVSASAHLNFFQRLTNLELSLFNLILRCKFIFTVNDSFFLINSGFVFVNGKSVLNPLNQLSYSDRIQIPIFKNYFFFKNFFFLRIKKDIAKLKNKFWRKRCGYFNLFRKRSKRWPSWIFRTAYYNTCIPNYIEIDYISLTLVIVFLPKYIIEYQSIIWRYINICNYRLYNWKVLN